jgi:hypothetical protein
MSNKHLTLLGLGALTAVAVSVLLSYHFTKPNPLAPVVLESGAGNGSVGAAKPSGVTATTVTNPTEAVNRHSADEVPSNSPVVSRAHFANQSESLELLALLDEPNIAQFANQVAKQTRWTSAKLEAVAQSNLACVSAARRFSNRLAGNDVVVAPVTAYVDHLAALKYFLQTYCRDHANASGRMQQILDARAQLDDMANLLRKFSVQFDGKLHQEFLRYINWEPFPQFAYALTEQVIWNIKSNRTSRALVLVPQINGDLQPQELTNVYALAAEIRACRYSHACDANMPYTMLMCMDRTNCVTGQNLVEFRKRWNAPVVFESAQRLAHSWESQGFGK